MEHRRMTTKTASCKENPQMLKAISGLTGVARTRNHSFVARTGIRVFEKMLNVLLIFSVAKRCDAWTGMVKQGMGMAFIEECADKKLSNIYLL